MRVLQIIDSLEIGGAERMAINYANALCEKIEYSGIVATRKEGNLKSKISNKVHYFFLQRKSKLDFKAVFELKKICIQNKISHLHAHSSSFFIAFLTKVFLPKIKIIWHDHNGLRAETPKFQLLFLQFISFFFNGIVVVNYQLKNWSIKKLNCKNVIYLANFTTNDKTEIKQTKLNGLNGKRIVCIANLRFPKNHLLLIDVANKLKISNPDWSFHLIGKDFNDDYSITLKNEIIKNKLENQIYIYGSKSDTNNIINQSDIAILTSQSEGLPVALLEYGLSKKAVVTTNVGEIPLIVKDNQNGFIVPKFDTDAFYNSLIKLIENENLRTKFGNALFETIQINHSENSILESYINWLKTIDGI